MKDQTFEQFFDNILDVVRERRSQLGLTQEQLAKRVGKPQSVIGRFESGGVRDPRMSMLFQICKAMEINPAEVFGEAYLKDVKGSTSAYLGKLKKVKEQAALLRENSQEQTELLNGLFKLL